MFCTFWLQNVLLATAACNFSTSQLQKVVRSWCVLYIFTSKCASRHSGVQFLISPLTTWLRTRRFNEPTFRLTRHTNHWKNTAFRDFSNIWRGCIFFLLTFALLHLLSSDSTSSSDFTFFWLYFIYLLFICFSTLHIVGSLLFKLPSTSPIPWNVCVQLQQIWKWRSSVDEIINKNQSDPLTCGRTFKGSNQPIQENSNIPLKHRPNPQPLKLMKEILSILSYLVVWDTWGMFLSGSVGIFLDPNFPLRHIFWWPNSYWATVYLLWRYYKLPDSLRRYRGGGVKNSHCHKSFTSHGIVLYLTCGSLVFEVAPPRGNVRTSQIGSFPIEGTSINKKPKNTSQTPPPPKKKRAFWRKKHEETTLETGRHQLSSYPHPPQKKNTGILEEETNLRNWASQTPPSLSISRVTSYNSTSWGET